MPPDEQTAEPQARLRASSSASKTDVSQSENQILHSWQTPSNKDPASWDFFTAYSTCLKTLMSK